MMLNADAARQLLLRHAEVRKKDHDTAEREFWRSVRALIGLGMTQRAAAETIGVSRECVRQNLRRWTSG